MLNRIATFIIIILALLPVHANSTVSSGWERHVISDQYRPLYLYVKDIDRDGALDVVSTTNQHPALFYSEVAWFRNKLKQNAPWDKFIIDSATGPNPITNANGVIVADIDGDGYEDVAVATGRVNAYVGGVYWYKAPADPTGAWQRFTIEEGTIDSYFKIYTIDTNNDGLKDLVVGGRQGVVIFLNPGNPALPGAVWQKINLPQGMGSSIYLDDLNNDGRLDIVNTQLHGNVSWVDVLYQNEQVAFNRTMIDANFEWAFDVNCLDVNGDAKKDVLVTTFTSPPIYWYENPSNSGDPWVQHLVSNTYAASDIYTGDINRDGKTDFIGSGLWDRKISWFEYRWENGQAVWTEHLIDDNINEPGDNSLNDLDGDGDLDVVICGQKEDQMIWYENKLIVPPTTTTTTVPPTLVTLAEFNAVPGSNTVTLLWATASEINNAGFNLYRSEVQNGTYKKINADIIPAQGSAAQGGSYKFIDNKKQNRKTYYYKLEDIDLNGTSTIHGPVSATPRLLYEFVK
jgi:hypothetical protein